MMCPCCGQAIDDLPLTELSSIPLSRIERAIVDCLVSQHPRSIDMPNLVDAVYPYGSGPEREDLVIRVTMTRLRKKLVRYGWSIPGKKGGRGYGSIFKLERVDEAAS